MTPTGFIILGILLFLSVGTGLFLYLEGPRNQSIGLRAVWLISTCLLFAVLLHIIFGIRLTGPL